MPSHRDTASAAAGFVPGRDAAVPSAAARGGGRVRGPAAWPRSGLESCFPHRVRASRRHVPLPEHGLSASSSFAGRGLPTHSPHRPLFPGMLTSLRSPARLQGLV